MKKKSISTILCLFGVTGGYLFAQTGPPDNPLPPFDETMAILLEIDDKVDNCCGGPFGIPQSGQTACWDEDGVSIPCAGTGQDGDHQAGFFVDPRFTDHGDGTVTDNTTGLIWFRFHRLADCFGLRNWTEALSDANTLADGSCGLTDGSVAGDWRLPNIKELHSLVYYGRGAPPLPPGAPFAVWMGGYWSSTDCADSPENAWRVSFYYGNIHHDSKAVRANFVWPVRGGR